MEYSKCDYKEILISNIDQLHTTVMGEQRLRRNLKLETLDVVLYCKNKIMDPKSSVYKKGKNFYCLINNIKITIHSHSYTIITASFLESCKNCRKNV